jgi:hypothetical protein
MIAGADLAFRYKNFSVGPGGNYGYVFRGEVDDPTCLSQAVSITSSCLATGGSPNVNNGKRDIGGLSLFGVGGFAKYSFGPQGRAFVQVRYIHYAPSLGTLLNRSGTFALSTVDLSGLPSIPDFADYPEFDGGRDIRATAGYVFGGRKFLRVQYSDRELNFTRTRGNVTGVFDQQSRTFTVGGGIIF